MVKVLMIEDDEDHYLLFSRYIAKISAIHIEWRDSLAQGLAYIESHPVDVALLDMGLPDGHGLEIFDRVQARFPTLPVIILSGNDDNQLALEAVRRGAQDYLVKGRVDGEILSRSLRYAVERKRVEERFRILLESAPDAMIIVRQTGEIVLVNSQTENIFGYRRDELIGKPVEILIPESFRTHHHEHRMHYVSAPRVRAMGTGLELHALRKDGSKFPVEISLSPIETEAGILIASAVRDVTERKQIEYELAAERNLLRTLIDSTPDYIFVKDPSSRFVMVNRAMLVAGGFTETEQVVGKTDFDFFPTEIAQRFYDDEQQVIASGQALVNTEEQSIDLLSGQKVWFLTTKVPLRDREGNITSLMGVSRNITRRKQAEEQLSQERNLLRTLIDSTPDFIFVKDLSSRFVMANEAVLTGFGLTEFGQLVGKTDFDFLPADIAQTYYDEEQQVIASGQGFVNKEESSTDRQNWFLTTKMPLRDGHGAIIGLLGIGRNITRRREAQEQLSQERDLLRTLIDSSPDYIFIKDARERFIISNLAHAQAVNKTPDELVGKTAFEVFPPDLAAQFHTDDEHILQTGKPLINLERSTIGEHGDVKTVLTSKIPLRDKDGQIIGLVGTSRDITEHKQLEAQTFELAAERERIRVMQRFIGDMSHDFRTPLTILSNGLYLLQKATDPQRQQTQIEKMEQQLLRLDKLLNELLQMTQLDRQDANLQFDLIEMNTFLKSLVQEYEFAAAAKQIAIGFVPDTDTCFASIDAVEFARVIISLLENAIAYTPEGGHITVRTNTQVNRAIISVQDTGMGIAVSDLPHIFERFYRADQARSTTTGGHGLGLSIAQKIIEAHGGSIQVESVPGEGSTFSIQLPLKNSI